MNIKDRIEKIIEDYSYAVDEARVRNNIKRSNIQLESFQIQHEQIKLDLENTIYQAYNDTKASYKLYQASKKTVSARKDAFQNAQKKFESGTINSFEYAQIKQRYDSSLSDQIRANLIIFLN